MVQPKYSPEEALERVKLMMKYDMSKTLNENKSIVSEQYVAPTVAAGATGAALGAGAVAATGTAGASVIVPVMGALGVGAATAGAIVGGAASVALLPLVYWLVTKDKGSNKVKKMFEMCSTEGSKISKLERKIDDRTIRDMSDNINDAVNYQSLGFMAGTDEEKLFTQFRNLQDGTASDFCALVSQYNKNYGDLWDDLDSDIDSESEWTQIFRPIRNCVEDSLMELKDESPKKVVKNEKDKVERGGGGGYGDCAGAYSYGCKSPAIAKVQACLGLVPDEKFGPKTKAALKSKGFESFTDAEIDKICGKTPTPTPQQDEFSVQVDVDSVDDILNN
jgi:hypothetical protein